MIAAGQGFVFPTRLMPHPVIMPTQGDQTLGLRFLYFDPAPPVIDVALTCWHPAARKDATRVPVLDLPSLGSQRPTSCGSFGNNCLILGVGDHVTPLCFRLALGDLTSDIGDDRSVSTKFPGIVCQLSEGSKVDMYVDNALALCSLGQRMSSE
jgi:hypothetical protein